MSSKESISQSKEYSIKDFYFELGKLQREKQGLEDEYLSYINLEDLDDSDVQFHRLFKEQVKNLDTLESSKLGIRTRSTSDIGPTSNRPNFKDIIRERKLHVAREGNRSQNLFCDYVAREYDKMWGLDNPYKPAEPEASGQSGPTEL